MDAGFLSVVELDNTSGQKTLQISHNFMQWPVVNKLFQEKKQHHNRKAGSKETPKLGQYGKLQPVFFARLNMGLRSLLFIWAETTLTLGSEFLMDQIGL